MSAHTPGPWTVETMGHDTTMDAQCEYLKAAEGTPDEWQPVMISDGDGPSEVVALAHPINARLIATAPEMLEALEAVMGGQIGGKPDMNAERFQKARAAIAKARGESK